MENIKIPSSFTILDSPNTPPVVARGRSALSPKKTKQITTASQKPKQTKSRNGCMTCKAKRLKCDETKPSCHQCERRKVTCGGYKKDFKWRPFEETNLAVGRSKPLKAKKSNEPVEDGTSSASASCIETEILSIPLTTKQSAAPINESSKMIGTSTQGRSLNSSPTSTKSCLSVDTQSGDDSLVFPEGYSTSEELMLDISPLTSADSDPLNFISFLDPFQQAVPLSNGSSVDLKLNGSSADPMVLEPLEFRSCSEPELDLTELLHNTEDIEELTQQYGPDVNQWNFNFPGQFESSLDFCRLSNQPALAADSEEMLAMRFDKITCGILSIKDGINENPWRTFVWPLAKDTPALRHAIFALSAFHSAKETPSVRAQGVKHMRQSMACLRWESQSMRDDTALATSLALAFADTWNRNTRTCVQHLRGAKTLMTRVLNRAAQGGLKGEKRNCIRFLYNTWTYIDVIARLTSLDESGFEESSPAIFQLPGDAVHEVDPLMGCAATLFPIIGRVGRLIQHVRRTSTNSVSIVARAMELKAQVEQWEPPRWFEQPEDPTSDVQHSVQVAYAYCWATLLYLHQAVPEMPSEPAEELAKRVLILLATVPSTSRTVIVQMFPLLAAGAEVDMPDDRKWVMDRWSIIQGRLMLGGIDRCLDVLREVWTRRDALKTEKQQDGLVTHQKSSVANDEKSRTIPVAKLNSATRGPRHQFNSLHKRDISVQIMISPSVSNRTTTRRGSALAPLENIAFERTVRSRLHWVNVMAEWGWEVFLG